MKCQNIQRSTRHGPVRETRMRRLPHLEARKSSGYETDRRNIVPDSILCKEGECRQPFNKIDDLLRNYPGMGTISRVSYLARTPNGMGYTRASLSFHVVTSIYYTQSTLTAYIHNFRTTSGGTLKAHRDDNPDQRYYYSEHVHM